MTVANKVTHRTHMPSTVLCTRHGPRLAVARDMHQSPAHHACNYTKHMLTQTRPYVLITDTMHYTYCTSAHGSRQANHGLTQARPHGASALYLAPAFYKSGKVCAVACTSHARSDWALRDARWCPSPPQWRRSAPGPSSYCGTCASLDFRRAHSRGITTRKTKLAHASHEHENAT